MSQYDDLAGWYDPLYEATGKDWSVEADAVLELVRGLRVEVGSVLDVACGTGRHLERLAEEVPVVAGVDASHAMLAIAGARLPDRVQLRHGDFRRFRLDRQFDLVTCMFSSIGHVRDEADLTAAFAAMAAHVAPGGVLVVEPWITPEGVREAAPRVDTATTDDGVVARTSRSVRKGDVLVVEFAWAVATRDHVTTTTESFRMPLFTRDRYLRACADAGLVDAVWTDAPALRAGRGLVVARRPVGAA